LVYKKREVKHTFKSGIGLNLNVRDLGCTLAFYTEKLGFKVLDYPNKITARLSTNSKDCFIGFSEAQPVVPSSACITFEVEDIEQAVQSLRQKGVEFKNGIVEVPNMVKLAEFTDPDGYSLMLFSQVQHAR
jgi:predicted enzyme related to lactoylglutathione lyase